MRCHMALLHLDLAPATLSLPMRITCSRPAGSAAVCYTQILLVRGLLEPLQSGPALIFSEIAIKLVHQVTSSLRAKARIRHEAQTQNVQPPVNPRRSGNLEIRRGLEGSSRCLGQKPFGSSGCLSHNIASDEDMVALTGAGM